MADSELTKDNSFSEDTTSETKPAICGWILLQMAADRKQSQQNKSPESSENELPGSRRTNSLEK